MQPDTAVIEQLARTYLKLADDSPCEISFYTEGAFNKLYKVCHNSRTWLMRVALPVEPFHKTASEVATIRFVRELTEIPAPTIFAHDSSLSDQNPLQFEWMIMELMPGRPLRSVWRKLPMAKKEQLVRQLAIYQSQLQTKSFDQIGNLYNDEESQSYDVGRIVALPFLWAGRSESGEHGPFRNSHAWLHAQLSLIISEKVKVLAESEDEGDIEDAQAAKDLGEELLRVLPEAFPEDETELTTVFHDDLSMMNILVDSEGDLTAIVDWECVSALPLWKASEPSQLLQGQTRDDLPQREIYAPASDDDNEDASGEDSPLDNEGMCSLYWDHLLEYEIGLLRPIFVSEMECRIPGWTQRWRDGELKRDFEQVITNIDQCWALRIVRKWLDAYRSGTPVSFASLL